MKIPFKSPSKDFYRTSGELKFIFDYLPKDHQDVFADVARASLCRDDTGKL
ncbi:MAG: hypothetical protein HQM11_18975 [SAR324 cluster bacterium]|nr:hypothetical protein [SAR324 cluster bacterium]